MLIVTEADLSGYDISPDTIINNIDNFLTEVILGSVNRQQIVVDEGCKEAIGLLNESGFEIIMLHTYLKSKVKKIKEKPKEKKVKKNTILHTNISENVSTEKRSFFDRIFHRKKKQAVEVTNIDSSLTDVLTLFEEADERGKKVKSYCRGKGYLNDEQIKKISDMMELSYQYGEHKRFIQCAREGKFLTEDQAAEVLAKAVNKEVKSKTLCTPEQILIYNKEILDLLTAFFIFKIDESEKKVYICKDCSENPPTHILERTYMGYKVITYNVVEGVTREVIKDLKAGVK